MIVGAGTVLNEKDLNAAIEAGAKYALSPGGTPKLMKAARKAAIPFVPGVATASEIQRGLELGYACFKFFPAEQLGGVPALKALAGPLRQLDQLLRRDVLGSEVHEPGVLVVRE